MMRRNSFLTGILICFMVGLLVYTNPLWADDLVMEAGPRDEKIPDDQVKADVEKRVGHPIPQQNIYEPLRSRIQVAVRNLAQDRANMFLDAALNHVELIGRKGMIPTGSITRVYLNPTGGEISAVGENVCKGGGTNLPGGGLAGGGTMGGLGAAGGGAGPNKDHPNAPRVGPRQKGVGGGAGGANNGFIGRAPNLKGVNGAGGDTMVLLYESPQDGYASDVGKLGVEETQGEGLLENEIEDMAPQTPTSDTGGVSLFIPEKYLPFPEISKQAFSKTKVQLTFPFAFALEEKENNCELFQSDQEFADVTTRSSLAVAKQNPENLATQLLSGSYWRLGIEDRLDGAEQFIMQNIETERSQIRTLASVSNALLIELNQAVGVNSVDGRSESLWDIKGVLRILFQQIEQLIRCLKEKMKAGK